MDEVGEAVPELYVDAELVAHAGGTAEVDIGGQADHVPVGIDEEVREAEVLAGHSIVLSTNRFERPELDQPERIVVEMAAVPRAEAVAERQVLAEVWGETDVVALFERS